MTYLQLTDTDIAKYKQDGYVIKRGLFSPDEIDLLRKTYEQDKDLQQAAFDLNDSEQFKTKLSLWYNWGDDIYGAFMRSERILNGVEKILGGTVALYHTKFMQKEPEKGGAWEWHQDYGYWYKNGFLFPHMLSVMVAVSEANKENGCLQVIKGTHLLGRIDHHFSGEQVGADLERVNACLNAGMELVYVELQAGDVLYFHSNLLHRSDANRSKYPRLSMISAYNLTSNKPFKNEPDASYLPVTKMPDEAILKNGVAGLSTTAGFLNPDDDVALERK